MSWVLANYVQNLIARSLRRAACPTPDVSSSRNVLAHCHRRRQEKVTEQWL